MTISAEKIQAWRSANPGLALTEEALLSILGLRTLRYADIRYANLQGANLQVANLQYANLQGANIPGLVPLQTPSGSGWIIPTPAGWIITIGCWRDHTIEDLRDLVEDRTEWPEATGPEREARRPALAAVLALAEANAAYYAHVITDLKVRWSE